MQIFWLSFVSPAKTCFHSVDTRDIELSPKRDTSSFFLGFVDRKPRLLEAEVVAQFAHDKRKNASFVRLLVDVVSIHEYILSTRMPMKVTN